MFILIFNGKLNKMCVGGMENGKLEVDPQFGLLAKISHSSSFYSPFPFHCVTVSLSYLVAAL